MVLFNGERCDITIFPLGNIIDVWKLKIVTFLSFYQINFIALKPDLFQNLSWCLSVSAGLLSYQIGSISVKRDFPSLLNNTSHVKQCTK
jgi:hypothetical protein